MKIDPNLQSITNAQADSVRNAKSRNAQDATASGAEQNAQADGAVTVRFSGTLAQVQQLTSKLQTLPDVRTERVAALREKIQQGTYKPNLKDVANAMVDDSLGQGGHG